MARQTIQQEIKLTGGTEVVAQLKAIGTAGEAAGRQLKTALGGTVGTGFAASIAMARARISELLAAGVQVSSRFRETGKAVGEVGTAFFEVGKRTAELALAIGGLEFGLGRLAKSSVDAVNSIERQAQAFGVSSLQLQRLQFAAKASGLGVDQLGTVLTKVNLAVEQFGTGVGKAADTGVKSFKDLGITVTDATKASNFLRKSQDDLTKSVSGGDAELKNTSDVLKEIGFVAQGDVHANLLELAKDFAKITDAQKRFALESKFVGTRQSAVEFDALLRSLTELEPQFDKTGAAFTDFDKKAGKEGEEAFAKLETSVSGLKDKIGLALVPALSQFAEGLTELIATNLPAIQAFVRRLADEAIPVIKDFFNALSGNDAKVQNPAILRARDNIVQFGKDVGTVAVFVAALFRRLAQGITFVTDLFNQAFGTKLNATVVIAIGFILRFLGVFRAIGATATLVSTALGGLGVLLLAIFTPGGLIAVGIGALLGLILAIATNWDAVVAALEKGWNQISDAASKAWADVKQAVSDGVSFILEQVGSIGSNILSGLGGVFDQVIAGWEIAFQNFLTFVGDIINTIRGWISDLVNAASGLANLVSGALSGSLESPVAHADGGFIRGPGGPRSDSILARLSNGEFVVNAAATKRWLPLLHAINSFKALPEMLRGFSLGGAVNDIGRSFSASLAIPRFASGGIALAGTGGGTSRTVRLEFQLGDQVFVAQTDEQTVAGLSRAAAKERMLSIGSPPRRIAR